MALDELYAALRAGTLPADLVQRMLDGATDDERQLAVATILMCRARREMWDRDRLAAEAREAEREASACGDDVWRRVIA